MKLKPKQPRWTEIPKAAEVDVSAEPEETVMVKETKVVDIEAEPESAEMEEEHKVLVVPEPEVKESS